MRRTLLIFCLAGSAFAGLAAGSGVKPGLQRTRISRNFGVLPLSFESNRGQAESSVRFISRGAGYVSLFHDRGVTFELTRTPSVDRLLIDSDTRHDAQTLRGSRDDVISLDLVKASGRSAPQAESKLPGTVNYLFGRDQGRWLTGVPTYSKIRYAKVYPGIDLLYHGRGQRLEFDFELSPGADPGAIQLRFRGAKGLRIDEAGDPVIRVKHGEIKFQRPTVFQPVKNSPKQPIDGWFRIEGRNSVGFRVGNFDRSAPLIIDPVLNYSTYLGASGDVNGIAVDSVGDAFITGWAQVNLPTTPGAIEPTSPSQFYDHGFVAKLNPAGTGLIYCTYLGGSGVDIAYAIAINAEGNAYVGGNTSSSNFPITPGAFQSVNNVPSTGFGTGFVAELNSTGTSLVYSTFLGGTASTWVYGLQLNAAGNAYVTGGTSAADFPITKGAFQSQIKATYRTGFVTELDSAGAGLVFSTYLGGSKDDVPAAIAIDTEGNAYVAGTSLSTDFPTISNALSTTYRAYLHTGFVTKVNSSGTALDYSTYLGGNYSDTVSAIAVDSAGEAYVTGYTGQRHGHRSCLLYVSWRDCDRG